VLGVDGQDLAAMFGPGASHHVSGGDQHFLVGMPIACGFQRGVDRGMPPAPTMAAMDRIGPPASTDGRSSSDRRRFHQRAA